MASIGWALLFFLAQLHILFSALGAHRANGGNFAHFHVPFLCHPDQAKALLQLKKSFSFHRSTTKLLSWQNGTDCCLWEGVGCDPSSGHVTILDLNNRGLSSRSLDPALFSLTSLRRLDLSMNDIGGTYIPATGFERFTFLTHLNLSNLWLNGEIPIGISKLVNLLSLDLSSHFDPEYVCAPDDPNNYVDAPYLYKSSSFHTLVANLSNLRELYLDSVDLSCSGEEWGIALAEFVPHLEVLSLAYCGLTGPIHRSLSRLSSLAVVNLQGNNFISPGLFPQFFMNFLNLTVLQLYDVNLGGAFPPRSFQSKKLRVLDLSHNRDLSGHFPNFSTASSLETLRLDGTNFSYAKPISSSNFKSLKNLSLDGNLSVDFLSSFGELESLCQLDLILDSVSELGSILPWIGHRKSLTSLGLSGCNFSGITPTLFSNLKPLRSLRLDDCDLSRIVLPALGDLVGLQTLEMTGCRTYGSMPSSIGNLTSLRNMYISDCEFSGKMPDTIGNLTNLKAMDIIGCLQFSRSSIPYGIGQLSELERLVLQGCNFSGSIPSSVGNLTQLTMLDLSENSLSGKNILALFVISFLIICIGLCIYSC